MLNLLDATTNTTPDWTWITQGGAIGVLSAVVVGLLRGWLVPGWVFKQVRDDLEDAREKLERSDEVTQRALEAAQRLLESPDRRHH